MVAMIRKPEMKPAGMMHVMPSAHPETRFSTPALFAPTARRMNPATSAGPSRRRRPDTRSYPPGWRRPAPTGRQSCRCRLPDRQESNSPAQTCDWCLLALRPEFPIYSFPFIARHAVRLRTCINADAFHALRRDVGLNSRVDATTAGVRCSAWGKEHGSDQSGNGYGAKSDDGLTLFAVNDLPAAPCPADIVSQRQGHQSQKDKQS